MNLEDSSFRDPSGFLFYHGEEIYRQVNNSYREDYDRLIGSGLYDNLVESGLLVPHVTADVEPPGDDCYMVIKPEMIPFVSYPYEWCFGQLKSAALATIKIQSAALEHGMTLKDASAYNIQFRGNRPLLIDTLSFEEYEEGRPWNAYGQFCRHFMAPLALMAHRDVRLGQLLRIHVDGIPLDLASKLLPARTRAMFSILSHIHAHAKSQEHYQERPGKAKRLSRRSLEGIVQSLRSGITKLEWGGRTQWGDYYSDTNYSEAALSHKRELVLDYITRARPRTVWDLGANTGMFSRLACGQDTHVVAFDADPAAVEKNYLDCVKEGRENLLPLLLDLTNPSPYLGWENAERRSFASRGPADMILALALVHHLAISNNVPLERIARFLAKLCSYLVIEFVPKDDSQVRRLLASRVDVFSDYTRESFESAFGRYFEPVESRQVNDSYRTIYLMKAS